MHRALFLIELEFKNTYIYMSLSDVASYHIFPSNVASCDISVGFGQWSHLSVGCVQLSHIHVGCVQLSNVSIGYDQLSNHSVMCGQLSHLSVVCGQLLNPLSEVASYHIVSRV